MSLAGSVCSPGGTKSEQLLEKEPCLLLANVLKGDMEIQVTDKVTQ